MDLSDDLRRQLEDSVFNYLGPMPTVLGLRVLVGPEAVRELPSGLSPYQHAQWVVRVALGHPDPDVFIGVVRNSDAAGQLLELQAIAAQLEADPGAWSAPAG